MSRVFFAAELETAATYWRIWRRDGAAFAFTTHDRDLWFGGLLHRAAPGMLPSAIRLSAGFEDDGCEVDGALSHAALREDDLRNGCFDGASVETGIVDWETLESHPLYHGILSDIALDGGAFSAALHSAKRRLMQDPLPCTGPSCRAQFCGPGCDLPPWRFETRTRVLALDPAANRVRCDVGDPAAYVHGTWRWLDGPQTGQSCRILAHDAGGFALDRPLAATVAPGARAILRQGCDRTLATCADRFGNARNFRGEPFLPGTDLLTSYPVPR